MARVWKTYGVGLALLGLLLTLSGGLRAQTVAAVPQLDLNRFTGTWYEVARYPNKRQKKCVSDDFLLIAMGNKLNQLQVVTSCKQKTGYVDVRNAIATQPKKSPDGRLKLRFLWPFSEKDWVLALGPEYDWALVGSPNHKSLWVFSRTRVMKPEVLAEVKGRATAEGFATDKLVMTLRTGR